MTHSSISAPDTAPNPAAKTADRRGWLRGLGLRGRLYLLLMVSMLPLVVLVSIRLMEEWQADRRFEEAMVGHGINDAQAELVRLLQFQRALQGVLAAWDAVPAKGRSSVAIRDALAAQPETITFVVFADPEGGWLFKRGALSPVRLDPGAMILAEARLQGGAPRLLPRPVADPAGGGPALVFGGRGIFVGSPIEEVQRLLATASNVRGAAVVLAPVLADAPVATSLDSLRRLPADFRGNEKLRISRPIPGLPWAVQLEAPAESLRPARHERNIGEMVLALLVALGLGLALGSRLVRTNHQEVRRLRDQVNAFASDDTAEPRPLRLAGELGELDDAFRSMAGKIRAQRDALAADRELYQLLSRGAADWVWEQDSEFRFTQVHFLVEDQSFDPAPDAVIGKRRWDLDYDNLTPEMWEAHIATLRARKPFRNLILQRRRADGSPHVVRISGSPKFDAEGRFIGYRGTGADITKAFQAESAVAIAEQRWVAALESAGHGVWDWDLRANRFFRSRTWGRMLGLGADMDLHAPDLTARLMHPDDVEAAQAALRSHVEGRTQSYAAEFRIRHADGSWRWILDRGMAIEFNPDGSPARIIGTHTDVTEQKSTVMALRDSEARLRIILDHAPNVAIQGYDDSGRVTYWNQPAERILGWTAEEAAGRMLDQLFLTPDQATQFQQELNSITGTRRVVGPEATLVKHKSGRKRWILSNLFEIPPAEDGTRFIRMDVDITDTKRAEIRHAESEAQLSSIFLNAAMPTMIVDVETRAIIRVNKAFERVLEIPSDAAQGRVLAEFGVWEDPSALDRIYAELAKAGRLTGMEVRLSMPSGRKADLLVFADMVTLAGRPAVIAQGLDITEEKRAKHELLEATRWARTLVDFSPAGMSLTRRSDGMIMEVNDSICQLLEYSREELLGVPVAAVGHWADPDERVRAQRIFDARESLKSFRMSARTKTGKLVDLLLYCELVVLDDVQYILSQAIDVTELVRTQQALAESEQRMKTIFMHGPVPMVLAEVDSQAIIQVNPALERVLGMLNSDLMGKSLLELGIWTNLDDRKRMYEDLAALGRVENLETRFRAPSGELLDYQISVEVIPYGGRRAIIAHGFDVTANRRALREAERSRRWFRTLFEHSPISMTILDLEGRIILANSACSRMYGVPLDQIIGRTSGQNNLWVSMQDREKLWEVLKETGSVHDIVLERKTVDGRPLHVLAYMDRFEIDGESFYITQGIDITRAHESELALRALTALNSAAFNAVGECIVVHDAAGKVILVNAMTERVFQATGRPPLGATLLEPEFRWCGLDGLPTAPESLPFRAAFKTGKPVREQVVGLQLPLTAGQFDTRWFSVSCEPIDQDGDGHYEGTVTSFFDITGRIRAEAELRVLLDRLQLQLERMPIACFLTDQDFTVIYWNPASARMFGYTAEEILGRSAEILTPEDMRSTVEHLVRGSLADAAGVDFRNENLTRDGKRITCEWRSNPLTGADGQFVATMHMAIDMTEVLEAQRRLERLNEELEQRVAERTKELSNTVRELEQFSYTVAHDLRAPLRALDGYSSLLAEGGPESDIFLIRVRANVAHMTGLIDGLLNYGRIGRQALHFQHVNMNRVCDVVVADLRHAYPQANIEIGPMKSVQGDESLLRQVWTNLVSNACKFSSNQENSQVRLWCEPVGDGAIRFFVQDNGVGFDMKYAGKLFGVFERLHRQDDFSGSGIGLSIVKRIVERHGGTVGVESEAGKGSTFWFQLSEQALAEKLAAQPGTGR